jgi:hypothetical protein
MNQEGCYEPAPALHVKTKIKQERFLPSAFMTLQKVKMINIELDL